MGFNECLLPDLGILSAIFFAVITIVLAFLIFDLQSKPILSGLPHRIASLIKEASFVYLYEQYKVIWLIAGLLCPILFYLFSISGVIFFLLGAFASSFVGFFNMNIAVNSNLKTVTAANTSLSEAFYVAFLSGKIASITLTLIGILVLALASNMGQNITTNLIALSIGASLVSVFARLGGGIFTKGADMGADMVGKIEKNLPEDDAKNPAVIADNVGDNVGDCAGMSADLMESYIVAAAAVILMSHGTTIVIWTLILGLIASIIPFFFMSFKDVWKEMNRYFITSTFIFNVLVGFTGAISLITPSETFSFMIGSLAVIIILKITEYYTASNYRPVYSTVKASAAGHGTNIIYGTAFSYEAVVGIILVILASMFGCYALGQMNGIAFGTIGIVALSPAVLVLDIFGPISDNAGGIAEMSKLDHVRAVTDELDEVGNTTKAITKGYAISSAIFSSIALFYLLQEDILHFHQHSLVFSFQNPICIIGILYGCLIPLGFVSISLRSVGEAAAAVVTAVRNQFTANPNILLGDDNPNYNEIVTILTRFSIEAMILPSLLPILGPALLYGISVLWCGNYYLADSLLTFSLLGTTIIGSIISIQMVIAGGLWDNAKKYIEKSGLKGSDQHRAAVTGDTVGDPFKDTTGPSLNSLIKLANLTGMLLLYLI